MKKRDVYGKLLKQNYLSCYITLFVPTPLSPPAVRQIVILSCLLDSHSDPIETGFIKMDLKSKLNQRERERERDIMSSCLAYQLLTFIKMQKISKKLTS